MPKPSGFCVVEDQQQSVMLQVSDDEVYYAWPRDTSTTVSTATWKVYRRIKTTVGTASVYVSSYADGDENYDNAFNPTTAEGITAIQGLTYPAWGITIA